MRPRFFFVVARTRLDLFVTIRRQFWEENDGLRAEVARASAALRQLEQGHADVVDSVGLFLTQLTHVLEPMRDLVEKLGQASRRG